jgi:hydroxyacylglutathione hydrolase
VGSSSSRWRRDQQFARHTFLRTAEPEVIAAAERYAGQALGGQREVFAALRHWKDREYD